MVIVVVPSARPVTVAFLPSSSTRTIELSYPPHSCVGNHPAVPPWSVFDSSILISYDPPARVDAFVG